MRAIFKAMANASCVYDALRSIKATAGGGVGISGVWYPGGGAVSAKVCFATGKFIYAVFTGLPPHEIIS